VRFLSFEGSDTEMVVFLAEKGLSFNFFVLPSSALHLQRSLALYQSMR